MLIKAKNNEKVVQRVLTAVQQLPTSHQGVIQLAEDQRQSAAAYDQSLGKPGRMLFGKIVFASPAAHCYRVQADSLRGEVLCLAATELSANPFSVRSGSPLAVGTYVLFYEHPGFPYGVIIACLPPIAGSGVSFSDWVVQGGNVGFRREGYYNQFRSLFVRDGGQIDFNNNRPVDSLSIGEWSRFNPLGGGLFIDPVMLFMRVNERCGMWQFYMDNLLRIAAHNYDFRSSGSETVIRNDGEEIFHYAGYAPYAWEARGGLTGDANVHLEYSDDAVHYRQPKGKIEPLYADQQPFYRHEEYRGYLGQGFMRQIQAPLPISINRHDRNFRTGVGLFREQVGLDGSWAVQSAHSISLAKRLLIPVPKQVKLPEDPTGDDLEDASSQGYRFAGRFGGGLPPLISDQPTADVEQQSDGHRAAASLLDLAAHVYNWKGLHAFAYHAKDYHVPEEGAVGPFTQLMQPPNYGEINTEQWLSPPSPVALSIDHRYGEVNYYPTQVGLFMTPDGSLILRDGYGGEIVMSRGTIRCSAPGDVMLQPGRSVITYAGRDVILRARNSVDIYATESDVRLKAEHNLDMLAGNNGSQGRILLDCQASGVINSVQDKQGEDVNQNGIILKAYNSQTAVLGGSFYVKTGSDYGRGELVLDASKGGGDINLLGSSVTAYVDNGVNFALPMENATVVHRFGQRGCEFPTQLNVAGQITITNGGIAARGFITSIDFDVGSLKPNDENYPAAITALNNVRSAFNDAGESFSDYHDGLRDRWEGSAQIGNEEIISATSFAPRNADQLRVNGFTLPETYWQQLARLYNQSTVGWQERPIVYQGLQMYPHPGKEAWEEDDAFLLAPIRLFDPTSGKDVDRDPEVYGGSIAASWERQKLDGNYPTL